MKKDGTQKISLKKLTIAKITLDSMRKIEGGSSIMPSQVKNDDGVCFYEQ
ncbi:hypothetical protein [uncultured Aquimarina sp.]|nr:hypothetical protein [uncultured Aquimarina sp.]